MGETRSEWSTMYNTSKSFSSDENTYVNLIIKFITTPEL